MELTEYEKNKLELVFSYLSKYTNNWFHIKGELLKIVNNETRSKFSRRHDNTKKKFINDFEQLLINYWEELNSGNKIELDQNNLHDLNWKPKNHIQVLININNERKYKAASTKNKSN